jgi:hypothetical protein
MTEFGPTEFYDWDDPRAERWRRVRIAALTPRGVDDEIARLLVEELGARVVADDPPVDWLRRSARATRSDRADDGLCELCGSDELERWEHCELRGADAASWVGHAWVCRWTSPVFTLALLGKRGRCATRSPLDGKGSGPPAAFAAVCIRFARACVFAGQRPRDGAASHSQCAARPRKCRSAAFLQSSPRRRRLVVPRVSLGDGRRTSATGWVQRHRIGSRACPGTGILPGSTTPPGPDTGSFALLEQDVLQLELDERSHASLTPIVISMFVILTSSVPGSWQRGRPISRISRSRRGSR